MDNEKIIRFLQDKYIDLFDDSEAKFTLFCRSLNNDIKMLKLQLKLLRKQRENETYVFRNFEFWKLILENFPKTNFPKNDGRHRYFYKKNGRMCFRFKFFVSDMLEAKAMLDCPGNPRSRYSMLKSELLKYLQSEKKRNIQPISEKSVKLVDDKKNPNTRSESLLSNRWDSWMKS
ncbi:MAG: hypothetical protein P8N49_03265 [Opitutales bacterium]|nr:hypothetical protein [Opitutales bacterium]